MLADEGLLPSSKPRAPWRAPGALVRLEAVRLRFRHQRVTMVRPRVAHMASHVAERHLRERRSLRGIRGRRAARVSGGGPEPPAAGRVERRSSSGSRRGPVDTLAARGAPRGRRRRRTQGRQSVSQAGPGGTPAAPTCGLPQPEAAATKSAERLVRRELAPGCVFYVTCAGRRPVAALAERWHITRSQARDLLQEAKERGFLTPGTPGKMSRALTDKARALLQKGHNQ